MEIVVDANGAPDFDGDQEHAGREYVYGEMGFFVPIMITKDDQTIYVSLRVPINQIHMQECDKQFQVHVEETLINMDYNINNLGQQDKIRLLDVVRHTIESISHGRDNDHACSDACYF